MPVPLERTPLAQVPLDPAPLLKGHWYDALAAILDTELRAGHVTSARQQAFRLAVAAKRVLDLLSDPSTKIPQSAEGMKGALGAAPERSA